MAIDTINPLADSVLRPGDSFSFKVDDTYTSLTIEVIRDAGTEFAYDTTLGGSQSGYTVSIVDSGSEHTFTVSRTAGWDSDPQQIRVIENETGTSATTTFSYFLTDTKLYPEGMNPYGLANEGTLIISDTGTKIRGDVTEIDVVGGTVEDLGVGKVRVTIAAGSGTGDVLVSGTPLITEYARWTDALTIEGRTKAQTQGDLSMIVGPGTVANDNLARWDGTTGELLQESAITCSDNGATTIIGSDVSFIMQERSAAPAGVSAAVRLWAKDDVPTTLHFVDDLGNDHTLSPSPAKVVFSQQGAVPTSPTADTWYTPDDRVINFDGLWSIALGTASTPVPQIYEPAFIIPFAGNLTDIDMWVRSTASSDNGVFALYKWTPTNDSTTVGSLTRLGADMTFTADAGNKSYDHSQTGLSAAVSKGDKIKIFYRGAAAAPDGGMYFTASLTVEAT